jgi:hypothetical protein
MPIAKVKNPSKPGDYCPISIMPTLSKALELLMKASNPSFRDPQWFTQSGFPSDHSTTTTRLEVTDDFR